MKIIAVNKSATFEYFIEESFEAGISLVGTEVKSIRDGNVSLKESFIFIRNGQMTLKNMHIAPYKQGSFSNLDPRRDRQILMHKKEIDRLYGKMQEKG
ncbi:MAG: SsrA-binding protein, partial [Clostridia bacterium]